MKKIIAFLVFICGLHVTAKAQSNSLQIFAACGSGDDRACMSAGLDPRAAWWLPCRRYMAGGDPRQFISCAKDQCTRGNHSYCDLLTLLSRSGITTSTPMVAPPATAQNSCNACASGDGQACVSCAREKCASGDQRFCLALKQYLAGSGNVAPRSRAAAPPQAAAPPPSTPPSKVEGPFVVGDPLLDPGGMNGMLNQIWRDGNETIAKGTARRADEKACAEGNDKACQKQDLDPNYPCRRYYGDMEQGPAGLFYSCLQDLCSKGDQNACQRVNGMNQYQEGIRNQQAVCLSNPHNEWNGHCHYNAY